MSYTDVQIASRALIKLGSTIITSFSDTDAPSQIAGNLYDPVRDALLVSYPWRFAVSQIVIDKDTEKTPIADFESVFSLPSDFLRAISVGQGGQGRGITYRLQGGKLHTSGESVVLTYISRADDADFPPHFLMALISRLAAEFCIPLTENQARAEVFYKDAERDFERARRIDSQQDTPKTMRSDLLTKYR